MHNMNTLYMEQMAKMGLDDEPNEAIAPAVPQLSPIQVLAKINGGRDPMYIFPQTLACKAVQFVIGIRRQETAWGLKPC